MVSQNSCALFGASNYVNSWLGINYVVIAAGFSIISFIYMISRILPIKTKTTLTNFVWFEAIQLFISVLIVGLLLGFSQLICSTSAVMGSSLLSSIGAAGSNLSPFNYSQIYIKNLALNNGLTLLDNIYTRSIQYAIDAQIWSGISSSASSLLSDYIPAGLNPVKSFSSLLSNLLPGFSAGDLHFIYGYGIGVEYSALSTLYVSIFAPMLVMALGILIIQYIALPVLQAVAFTVILPVAITMRTLAFTGPKLRDAANAVLALAIAAYLVYPIMVIFSSYTMIWIFSSQNPLYGCTNCLNSLYATPLITTSDLTSTYIQASPNIFSTPPSVFSFLSSVFPSTYDLATSLFPASIPPQAIKLTSDIALFFFESIFLFAVSFTVTTAFAMGLARALSTGIGFEGPLWSKI